MPVSIDAGHELDWSTVRDALLGMGDEGVLAMESNRRLFRRWIEAGHGEWMVARDAFDVVELGDLVGSLCVHDRDEEADDYRCRVFGSTVAEDLGIDMTGRRMASYPEWLRQAVRRGYDQALAAGMPYVAVHLLVRNEVTGLYPREDGRVLHEKLILPMTRSGRGIDCFLAHVARLPADTLADHPAFGTALPDDIA